jgi:hypothetical protein
VSLLFKPAGALRGYTRHMTHRFAGLTFVASLVISLSASSAATAQTPRPACRPDAAPAPASTLNQLSWLAGVWIGVSGAVTIEEHWTPPAGGAMLAVSRTVKNGVMSAFEFLCIVEREGGLVYAAMPNGRSPATEFKLTKLEADGATFENPAHDFPKMIRYTRRDGGTLEAVVSGSSGENAEKFVFKRQNPPRP